MITRSAPLLRLALLLAAAGCSSAEPEAEQGGDTAGRAPEPVSWTGRSPSGVIVRVRPVPFPVHPGPARFEVTVDAGAAARPLSADLVSPTMPVHGITRFDAARAADGSYEIVAEIPMEGEWMLYVNLDDGDDAVPFEFDVVLPDSGEAPQPGSHSQHAPGTPG